MGVDPCRAAEVAHVLALAGCVAAADEARLLITGAVDEETLDRWVQRRTTGEPLAWITGTTTFCGRALRVDPGVYVPRQQTEDLARRAAALLADRPGPVADLCTGAGAVACHLQATVPAVPVVGVDLDHRAVTCARSNGVSAIRADLDGPLRGGTFEVVTAVVPYVPTGALPLLPVDVRRYEPELALDGGVDGLAVGRRAVTGAARILRPGGWLLLELGGEQDEALAGHLHRAGFDRADPWRDDDGDLRGLAARWIGH